MASFSFYNAMFLSALKLLMAHCLTMEWPPEAILQAAQTLAQVPCFIVLGATLRNMGFGRWPGMVNEGALWFPDLTQVWVHVPGCFVTLGSQT